LDLRMADPQTRFVDGQVIVKGETSKQSGEVRRV